MVLESPPPPQTADASPPAVASRSRGKFVVMTVVLAFVTTSLIVGAVASAEWMTFSSSSAGANSNGLFSTCAAGTCMKFEDSAAPLAPVTGCTQPRNEIINRMHATAGLLITAAILAFFVALVQTLHVVGFTTVAAHGHGVMVKVLGLATALAFIGVVVYGATMSNYIGCGKDYCTNFNGSTGTFCGIGYSFVFAVVGTIVLAGAAGYIALYTHKPTVIYPSGDAVFVSTVLLTTAIVLILVAVGTPQWHMIIPAYENWGLFKTCTTASCKAYSYTSGVVPTTAGCSRNQNAVAGFNVTSALFLIVAATILLVYFLIYLRIAVTSQKNTMLFTRTKKWAVISALGFALALQLTSFILQENLYDNWYFCGKRVCDVYSGFCRFGMSYGFIITSMCLTAIMIAVHYFELRNWCCFQERFASGRHSFTLRSAWETLTKRDPTRPLGTSPAPPLPPTATAQAAAGVTAPIPPAAASSSSAAAASGAIHHEPMDIAADSTIQLPPGDWEYDSVSGYYWCEQIYLFYDPETRQYYDPATDQWINTETRSAAANAGIAPSRV